MSKEIDQRVVEMRFDNAHFEKNVQTSMSTLDKLKQKLNLSGASKGLENVSASAKKCDLGPLSKGAEAVRSSFSALEVMGVTALANITNSAVNAGKRIVKALTLEPVMTGFKEYETQINAVQTILANTQSKGTTLDQVNAALDELNVYADKTIYNFTEMTRNIGTFTAAGVDLETSVSAIQGIANLAAISGSTSQQASTAMYQLSQALAAGTVKLMDWNSVVNAGMGGEVFQTALKETSKLLGTGAEAAIEASGSFRESLRDGWLTSEVLTETLKKFTTSGAKEYIAEYTGLTLEQIEAETKHISSAKDQAAAIDAAAEALAKKSGKNKEEIKDALNLAQTAEDAATKVKTFTQLMDTVKEAVQSGWAQTWRLLIGDFEEAKELFSGISDFLTGDNGILTKMSNARNAVLESALGKSFTKVADSINTVIKPAAKAVEVLENLDSIVGKVINGEFGNGETRINKLTEAGYNYYKVQNKVNETLGDSYRHSDKLIESQEELLGTKEKTTEKTKEETTETVKLTDANKNQLKSLLKMTEEQLRSKGYTDEQIEALQELGETAKKLGIPLDEFVDNLDQINGRWLLLNSFKNIGKSLIQVFTSMGDAWKEVFPPKSTEERADALFELIAAFHKLSAGALGYATENAEELKDTFQGLFAAIDIVRRILGGAFSIVLNVVKGFLGAFGLDVLDVTAAVGRAISSFRDWLVEHDYIATAAQAVGAAIAGTVKKVKEWITAFLELPAVQAAIEGIKSAVLGIKDVGSDVIAGLANGLWDGITSIPAILVEIGTRLISAIKSVLGIESPSTVMFAIGGFIIAGLIGGLLAGSTDIWGTIQEIGGALVEKFKGVGAMLSDLFEKIDFGKVFAAAVTTAILLLLRRITGLLENFNILEPIGEVLTSFSKVLDSVAFENKTKGFKNIAASLLVVVVSVMSIAIAIKKFGLSAGDIAAAIFIVVLLGALLAGLAALMSKMSGSALEMSKNALSFKSTAPKILSIGLALLAMAGAIAIIGGMDSDALGKGIAGLTLMIGELILLIAAYGLLVRGESANNIKGFGKMLTKLAVALLLMVVVMKLVSGLDDNELGKGIAFIAGFTIFVAALSAVTRLGGNNASQIGSMVLKLTFAMGLMVGVVKLISLLKAGEMFKGAIFAGGFVAFVGALVAVTKITNDQQLAKIGGLMMSMSFALLMLVGVCKLAGTLSVGDILKGLACITIFTGLILAMIAISKLGDKQTMGKVSASILAMSAAIGIMAVIAVLLSFVDIASLAKGIVAVGILAGLMIAMTKSLKGAQNVKGSLIAMAVCIGIMAASIVALALLDDGKVAAASAALSAVMGTFALLLASTKYINTSKGALIKSIGTILVMLGVVAILAEILKSLGGMDPTSSIGVATALGELVLAISGAVAIIGSAKTITVDALAALLGMTLVTAALALILSELTELDPVQALGVATALSTLLLAISAACAILSLAGPAAVSATAAAWSLVGLLGVIAAVILAVGSVVAAIPGSSDFLDTVIEVLEKLGTALGSFFGGIVGGFASGMTSSLPSIAQDLSDFMDKLGGFIDGAEKIKPGTMDGVKSLVEAILYIIGADFINGIAEAFGGGSSSLSTFGEQLIPFGESLVDFSDVISDVDSDAVKSAGEAAKALADFASAIPNSGGLFESIGLTGSNNMDDFGDQIVAFGECLVGFSNVVKGNLDEDAIKAANAAGEMMVSLANSIPNSGGLIEAFTGSNDFDKFGAQMVSFGYALVDFSDIVAGKIDSEAVEAAKNAGAMMVELAATVPNSGGVVSWFTGDNKLDDFGDQIVLFGEAMTNFSDIITTKGIDKDAVQLAHDAGEIMVKLGETVPNSNGIISFFTGDNKLDDFGDQIVLFGEAMTAFSDTVSNGAIDQTAVEGAAAAGAIMSTLASGLPDDPGWFAGIFGGDGDLESFGKGLVKFGESMVEFSGTVSGKIDSSTISSLATATKTLADVAISLPDDIDFTSLCDGLTTIGEAMVSFSDDIAGNIDLETISSVVTAAKTIATTAAIMPDDVDLSRLTNGLDAFGTAIVDFSKDVSGNIDLSSTSEAVEAAKGIADIMATIPPGFNMSGFVDSVGSFGDALVKLTNSINEGLDESAIAVACTAGTSIANMINEIPPGIIAKAEGFIANAANVGEAISNFSSAISDDFVYMTVEEACLAGGLIAGMIDTFPPTVYAEGFYNNAEKVGSAIAAFSSAAIDNIDSEAVNKGVTAGEDIAAMLTSLSETTAVDQFISNAGALALSIATFSKVVGEQVSTEDVEKGTIAGGLINSMIKYFPDDIATMARGFADNVGGVGSAIASFSSKVSEGVDVEAVRKAKQAGELIADLIKNFPESVDLTTLNTSLPSLGTAIRGFANNVVGSDYEAMNDAIASIKTALAEIKQIAADSVSGLSSIFDAGTSDVVSSMNSLITSGANAVRNNASLIETAFGVILNKAVSVIRKRSDEFKSLGKALAGSISDGIESRRARMKADTSAMLTSVVTTIRAKRDSFYSAGRWLGDGLVNGINSKKDDAYRAGFALGQQAAQGEKDGQKSGSPSKLTIQNGKWLGEGLIIGMHSMGNSVYAEGYDIGRKATLSVSKAINQVSSILEEGIDTQPTIKPVVDLSDVVSKANQIKNLLNIGSSSTVTSNVRAISSSMNGNQNGGNNELADAFNQLSKKLDNVSSTTYNVNGVTYDDGSNVSAAVKSLVKAARIERRA